VLSTGAPRMSARCTAGVAAAAVLLLVNSGSRAANGSYAELVRQVTPSVVTVLVERKREGAGQRAADRASVDVDSEAMHAIMRRLLSGPGSAPEPGDGDSVLGSGFIISADGLIVTNRHVVVGARTVRVKLSDGRQVPAKIIGADAATDIALLKVSAGVLPVLRLGSSDAVSVGDPVIAIGDPFGVGQSVSSGIVSARGRELEADPYIDFLQTDAAINFGNSGGPLLTADGTVVGVTSTILSPSGGSIGLGFAIPAETVASVVTELEAHGRVNRGYLGISGQPLTPALARALGLDSPGGILITAVDPHGPDAGILFVGDVLLKIASAPVTFTGLGKTTARLKPGATVDATLVRDGVRLPVTLKIGQLPDPPADPALTGDADTWVPNLALDVANVTPEILKAIKAEDETGGVIITRLRPTGAGALAELKVGDLITHAGTKRLANVADLAKVLKPSIRVPLVLRIVRDGSPRFVAITGSEEE
jgi:serine protease Do